MIEAAMGGEKFTLPAGCYVNDEKLWLQERYDGYAYNNRRYWCSLL